MRLPEQKLWDRMRLGISNEVMLIRVENRVATGFADVVALAAGKVTMLELKAAARAPKRSASPVLGRAGCSVAQRNWHMLWHRNGGTSFIIVRVAGMGPRGAGHMHFAVSGALADEINAMSMDELTAAAEYSAAEGPDFWQALGLRLGASPYPQEVVSLPNGTKITANRKPKVKK